MNQDIFVSRAEHEREKRFIFDFFDWFSRPVLLFGLILSIPAFYLLLLRDSAQSTALGHGVYGLVAFILFLDLLWQWRIHRYQARRHGKMMLDMLIILGCVLSAIPTSVDWTVFEWLLRLGLCALILLRMATLVLQHMQPSHLMQVVVLALMMLSTAGAGFYWLEPRVATYADGIWLAFTTVATVGYGDIVPSTPASKIFAVFIVLLGYAMFSIVTANIAALFVGEEEERFERELHNDIKALHQEIAMLREELRAQTKTDTQSSTENSMLDH